MTRLQLVFTTALALVGAEAACAQSSAKLPCDKNHYILDEPCTQSALDTAIGQPHGIATDARGNVYFSSPHVIFRLDAVGGIERIAGGREAGFAGDGGPAKKALLNIPITLPEPEYHPLDYSQLVAGLAVDLAGNIYVADAHNDRIRRIDPDGVITTVGERLPPHHELIFWLPQGVGVDAAGNLYVSDAATGLSVFRPDGTKNASGTNCGSHLSPGLCDPKGLAIGSDGAAYVGDIYCRVRRADRDGGMFTVAGADWRQTPSFTFTCGNQGDGIPATQAAMLHPFGVAVTPAAELLIADTYNNCIRKVDRDGIITTFAGACGWEAALFEGDGGPAIQARLNRPFGVAADHAGNVYIADTRNGRIRKVTPDGIIRTVAGTGAELER